MICGASFCNSMRHTLRRTLHRSVFSSAIIESKGPLRTAGRVNYSTFLIPQNYFIGFVQITVELLDYNYSNK